jgi:hypothetical protein
MSDLEILAQTAANRDSLQLRALTLEFLRNHKTLEQIVIADIPDKHTNWKVRDSSTSKKYVSKSEIIKENFSESVLQMLKPSKRIVVKLL